ncbi:MAG: hypothetical protein JNN28_11630 [Saprospiraceae bacterium]|nr:hypothetical protein [Saprospiraceae bacterium]
MPHLSCFIWLTLCCIAPAQAQTNLPRLTLRPGITTMACRPKVKIYTEPSRMAMALGYIQMGERVRIEENTQLVEAFDGLFHFWYKVSIGQDTGYVLGAHLAVDYFETTNGLKHIIQLKQPSEGHPDQVDMDIISIRAVGQEPVGTLSTRLTFEPKDMLTAKVYNNRGLKKYDQVIILERWIDQCPYYIQETALLYKAGTFTILPTTAKGKSGCTSYSYIFPSHYNGLPDIIQLETTIDTLPAQIIRFHEMSPGLFLPVKE